MQVAPRNFGRYPALYELLNRAVKGDGDALAELVRQLEPVIRRAVRVHLAADDPLRRVFDSLDVSQSVLMNFLTKAGTGAITFQSPEELRGLLTQMAAQKFIDKRRSAEAACRDHRRQEGDAALFAVADGALRPDEVAAERELYHAIRSRFTARERQIADLWAAGHTFREIAESLRGSNTTAPQPNALRMTLERAFARVAGQLQEV